MTNLTFGVHLFILFICFFLQKDQTNTGKNIIFDEKLNKSRVVLTRIDESTVFAGSDNMKPKHSKRKTPEDGFGDIIVMAKRSKLSRQATKKSPLPTEMASSNPADLPFAQSTLLSDGLEIEEDPFMNAMKVSIFCHCDYILL